MANSTLQDTCVAATAIRQTNSLGGLPLKGLVALSESNPGLLAPRPYMPARSQPGRIVEGPGPDPHYAAARQAIYPTRAIWAHKPGIEPSAVGHALDRSRLACNATEGGFGQGNPQREGTARDPLAVSAMARIYQLRSLGDFVPNFPALTAAGLRKVHCNTSRRSMAFRTRWPKPRRHGPAPAEVRRHRRRPG
jgi:hypothetical protein